MRGEGVFRDRSQSRTWSRKRTFNGCTMKGNLDNVVLIDVDSDSLDNVIIIDVPESLQQKLRGSSVLRKGKKIQFGGIINIDDDKGNKEYAEKGVEGGGDLDSDTSSSKSFPASDYLHKSVNLGDGECRVVWEKSSASRLSKCKQSYPQKDPHRNRYGLNPESESSSSDSDCSDCELMEGSFGRLHKEWEKASLKRKSNFCKGKSGLEDQASPSCLNSDICPNIDVEVEERTEQHSENAFCCNSSSANYKKQDFVPMDDGELGTAYLNPGLRNSFVESDQKVDQESFPWFKPGLVEKVHSSRKKADFKFRGETFSEDPSSSFFAGRSHGCGSHFHGKEQSSHGPSLWCHQEQGHKQYHNTRTFFMDKQKNFLGEQFFQHTKAGLEDEEASLCKSQQSGETCVNNERAVPTYRCEELSQTTSSCSGSLGKSHHSRTEFMEKEKPISEDPLGSNNRPSSETRAKSGVPPSERNFGDVFVESFLRKTSSLRMPDLCNKKAGQLDTGKPNSKRVSTCNSECANTQSKQGNPCLAAVKEQVIASTADSQPCIGRDPFHAQSVSVTPAVQNDIINEREKLKETDEYKQAMEEEWASRQRQLQIQAEEAQRLRKKKRAESMRLLDMERRQKQRLEEIRETQKKDEENMNLKEKLRVEVRKELHKLEATCIDMVSLLRALGIQVGDSSHPLSHEVHAAYKRALLKFHPDRASKTDIRQQVEAEEKFKLISRMKEKFLLT